MGDSVEGFRGESGDILSLHVLARRFQPRLFSKAGSAAETVARLGAVGGRGERDEQRGQAGHEPVERPRAYPVGLADELTALQVLEVPPV
jgi:hypothetical protein